MPKSPPTDERLDRITVGERRPHDAPIELVPYDADWPGLYETLSHRIRSALGGDALLLEHVGSTSVPCLCAKPVIDIVLEVADSSDEHRFVPALEADGFALRIRETDWFEHRVLKAADIASNLHVFSEGCTETRRMLAFRDRLRDDADERSLYERTKRRLASRRWRHIDEYAQAKSEVVEGILRRADLDEALR